MKFMELLLIAVGLSMDAFAVSVCKGLSLRSIRPKELLLTGLYFGGFQFLMPLLGYALGVRFQSAIESVDHWVVFFLLAVIGGNMIRESFGGDETLDNSFSPKTMLPLAVATSIDALAVGLSFAFLQVPILSSSALIGVTTFLLSAIGVAIGCFFGARWRSRAEFIGGLILIGIGLKILLEHLNIL